jgi:RNA polymerase sigma-70 factor (ECF subfamily)
MQDLIPPGVGEKRTGDDNEPVTPRADFPKVLEELARRYRAPLRSYFIRRVHSVAEAEDLTQEVFLRVLGRHAEAQINNAEAFLFQTAANLFKDRARKEKVRARYLAEKPIHDSVTEILTPERVLQGKETLWALLDALKELNEHTSRIFLLYRMENLKYREIAEMLNISISTVERHVIKALAFISKRIEER